MAQGVLDSRVKKKGGTRFHLASFELETPTGYSPCGVVFGALRSCYSAPCKAFADDTERTNRIKWYFAEPDAQIYEGKHVFSPRIDNLSDDPTGLYELTGMPCPERRYNRGRNEWGAMGTHVDGDAQDFLGQSLHTKYMIDGQPPVNPCGLIQHSGIGMVFGWLIRDRTGVMPPHCLEFSAHPATVRHYQYIELAPRIWSPPSEMVEIACRMREPRKRFEHGLEFACVLRELVEHGIEFRDLVRDATVIRYLSGIEFVANVSGNAGRSRFGLDVGCVQRGSALAVGVLRGGIEFATPYKERQKHGIEFAIKFREPKTAYGIEFRFYHHGHFVDYDRTYAGIQFSFGVSTPTPPPSGPGSTCPTNYALTLSVPYTTSIAYGTGVYHWFHIHIAGTGVHHVVFTRNSGPHSVHISYFGPDCDHLSTMGTWGDEDISWVNFNVVAEHDYWYRISAASAGTMNYTIEVAPGEYVPGGGGGDEEPP